MRYKVHVVPGNARGLIGYSLYTRHLKQSQGDPRSTIVSIGTIILLYGYAVKPANKDT